MEWLAAGTVIIAVWLALLTGRVGGNLAAEQPLFVYCLPILLLGCFGLYAATVVLYRTFTFNTCEEAAMELQKEIQAAREDLARRGFAFSNK